MDTCRASLRNFAEALDRLALAEAFYAELCMQAAAAGLPALPPREFFFPDAELLAPPTGGNARATVGNSSHGNETGPGLSLLSPPAAPQPPPEGRGDATGVTPPESEGGPGGQRSGWLPYPYRVCLNCDTKRADDVLVCPQCKMKKNKRVKGPDAGDATAKGRSGFNPIRYATTLRLGLNDLGNAHRLLHHQGDNLLFCAELGGWYIWESACDDGGFFRLDPLGLRTKHLASLVLYEVDKERHQHDPGTPEHDAILWWADHCRMQRPWNDVLEAAKIEPLVLRSPEQMDHHPWLFNCANGTLDLRSPFEREGPKFRPASRADCMTKTSPIPWDPDAECKLWLQFLDTIMGGDQEMVRFLQRLAGYLLVAGNPEHKLAILHGTGANGKSVFVETLSHVYGDYASMTSTETLMDNERASNNQVYALAKLAGVRFLLASESKEGRRLDEALVKVLTGDKQLQARHPHGGFFNFVIEFTPWLLTNHRPEVRGQDDGIWRRLLLVPFSVRIPDAEQDKQLGEKLKLEASGILRWAVDGLEEYQVILDEKGGSGLAPPAKVQEATNLYRQDQDLVGPFFDDCCDVAPNPNDPEYSVSAGELRKRYLAWCDENGQHPIGPKPFAEQMKLRGFTQDRTGKQRLWCGLVLKAWDQGPRTPTSGHLGGPSGREWEA